MVDSIKGFETNEGIKQYDYEALFNKPVLITQEDVDAALDEAKQFTLEKIEGIDSLPDINLDSYVTDDELSEKVTEALTQAKNNGDFKGEPGDDYILTEQDKRDIVNIIIQEFTNVAKVGA